MFVEINESGQFLAAAEIIQYEIVDLTDVARFVMLLTISHVTKWHLIAERDLDSPVTFERMLLGS